MTLANKRTILASGFGLGFYIPALLLKSRLDLRSIPSEVVVFEHLLQKDKKGKIAESRRDYHANFAVAKIAQKLPMDIRDSLDFEAVDRLLDEWEREGRSEFVALSGHWVYVLDRYRERIGAGSLKADLLYVDAALSPSWKSLQKQLPDYSDRYREIWLYDTVKPDILYSLPVSDEAPVPYAERPERLVVHGGGWGMGTYLGKTAELEAQGYGLDVVVAGAGESTDHPQHRYYTIDPSWEAWNKEAGQTEHTFPRVGQIRPGEPLKLVGKPNHNLLHDVIRQAKAIISKPGGGTLIDSLSSATPVVFLEPFGPHEQVNAALWEQLGYGISYERWKQAGFRTDALEPLHERLLEHKGKYEEYADHMLEEHRLNQRMG